MTARRRRRSRLLGLLLLLLLLEGAWQLTALVTAALAEQPLPSGRPDADLVVLCAGDSNTFGLGVPAWSYPDQLRGALARRLTGRVQVVNRGVPGWNSAQVADDVEAALPTLEPDLVLLLAGVNDAWNDRGSAGRPWWSRIKLVQFARNLLAGDTTAGDHAPELVTDAKGELLVRRGERLEPVNPGTGDLLREGPALAASVQRELGRAVDACRAAGARPVLMTYAEDGGNHSTVNAALRELAAREDLLLVDHAERFAAAFAEGRYGALMRSDKHPNAAGYGLMTDALLATLEETGWIPAAGRPDGAPPARPAPQRPRLAALAPDRLELRGAPGWAWQLLVAPPAPAGSEGLTVGGRRLPLAPGAALDFSASQPAFTGRLGAEGRAVVTLPRALLDLAPGPLTAVAGLLRDPGEAGVEGQPLAAVSEPLELPGR